MVLRKSPDSLQVDSSDPHPFANCLNVLEDLVTSWYIHGHCDYGSHVRSLYAILSLRYTAKTKYPLVGSDITIHK